jgi:hypothetical protein
MNSDSSTSKKASEPSKLPLKFDQKNRLKNTVLRRMSGCVVCEKKIPFPYKVNKAGMPKIRCKVCQRLYGDFFFSEYEDYLAAFRGQV